MVSEDTPQVDPDPTENLVRKEGPTQVDMRKTFPGVANAAMDLN